MTDGIRNARFWTSANGGWVKLTLRYKQRVHHSEGGGTEEGFSVSHVCWSHEGMTVRREHMCRARDCDGLSEWGGTDIASLTELGELPLDDDWSSPEDVRDVSRPRWQGVDDFQRDHTAEAAGY